jgi:hypothetical protein
VNRLGGGVRGNWKSSLKFSSRSRGRRGIKRRREVGVGMGRRKCQRISKWMGGHVVGGLRGGMEDG